MGSGIYINVSFPEETAQFLREVYYTEKRKPGYVLLDWFRSQKTPFIVISGCQRTKSSSCYT
jgi:hypothetical protein